MLEELRKAQEYAYTSLKYTEPEEIKIDPEADRIIELAGFLLICELKSDEVLLHWGAESEEAFRQGMKQWQSRIEAEVPDGSKVFRIEFVPSECVAELERGGFEIESHFVDYWNESLDDTDCSDDGRVTMRIALRGEELRISRITEACAGKSRGFRGEEPEFIREWCADEHSCAWLAEIEAEAVGVCLVQIYGREQAKGPVVWIRELAVDPAYQNRGIGQALLKQSLRWGLAQGGKRSFLAADRQNLGAIHLYDKMGYRRQNEIGQINMVYRRGRKEPHL